MFDDRSPIYRQIADQVKAEVVSGTLDGDQQVMSTNQYAAFYRINPATVAKAFQQLVDGQPVFENPRSTRRVCLIRETGDTGDRDERVRDALYTAARLRPGWDRDYADALVERFQIPRGTKLGQLSLGQRSALG